MPAGRPGRKRKRAEEDPLASDPQDSDYQSPSPQATRKRGATAKKRGISGKGKKRKTNNYGYNDDEDDISMAGTPDESFGEGDVKEELAEIGPTGRPLRQSRKTKAVNYDETEDVEEADEEFVQVDDGDVVMSQEGEEEEEGEGEGEERPKAERPVATTKGKKTKKGGQKSLMIKIKVPKVSEATQAQTQPRRSTRATSATAQSRPVTGGKAPGKGPMKTAGRGGSAGPPPVGYGLMTRRSSRLGHTDEPLAQLTTSGKHVEIIKGTGTTEVIMEEGESSLEAGGADATGEGDEQIVEAPETQRGRGSRAQSGTQAVNHHDDDGFANVAHDVDDGHEADEDDDELPSKRIRNRIIVVSSSRRGSTTSPRATRSGGGSKDPTVSPSTKRTATGGKRPVYPRAATRGTSRKAGESDEDEYRVDDDGEESADDSSSNASSPQKSRGIPEDLEDEDDFSGGNTRGKGKGKRPLTSASQLGGSKRRRASSDERLHQRNLRRPAASSGDGEAAPDRTLRRRNQHVDYRILRPENANLYDDAEGAATPSRKRNGGSGAAKRFPFDTSGPFGGGGPFALFNRVGRVGGFASSGDIDSDSSDDDRVQRPGPFPGLGGVGMTPTSAAAPGLLAPVGQTHNLDPLQGTPANLGKVTKPGKQSLSDSDPLGVDTNIDFSSVGGLDDKIQQLKEMVQLPLTYPEIFQTKNITPPRGVLFHGPPGTGKTLMARALAASCSTETRKVTFYMRKGADCLSKWVGEAERQLRLLFEEAKNNQPSIIFFDEIDGLAPVRSSKQDQIHASIVSTLLALMDGMDGRGQVVVIGATNRPDAVDPALRRPGRFDREFYFPLPSLAARRQILEIHTKGWQPPLSDSFKDQLAEISKGYGGADLRALCTEAALNSIQRTYPQIYMTSDKLQLDPKKIEVTARDFMTSMKKMIPSSERATASGSSPLPKHVEPLLSAQLELIKESLEGILPERKRMTILEEALYEDFVGPDGGFERERMMQDFETSRVFRPRLLIHGPRGMGQQYIGAGILHHFEKLHVQSFDLATLISDSARSPEAAIVQLFVEVKRHKPSVIYIPDVDIWYRSIPEQALVTFRGLLQSIPSNDPVLVLGITSTEAKDLDPTMLRDLFGYSRKDKFELTRPGKDARLKYFDRLMSHIRKSPDDFPPDPTTRKKRELEVLPVVVPPPPRPPTKAERKTQEMKDRQIKNWLKIRLAPLIELIKNNKYKRFKKPALEYEQIKHLVEPPDDSDLVTPDIPQPDAEPRRFQLVQSDDIHSPPMFLDTVTNKKYHNIDVEVIEERFSNGHYCTPKQFLQDLEYLKEDTITVGDKDRKIKMNEMFTYAEVLIADVEMDTAFLAMCEDMYKRERERLEELADKIERKKKTVEGTTTEETDKVVESVDRQGPGSLSKQVERESTAPVAADSVSTSNGVKEPGASPGEQPRAAIGAHSPPSNGQQTQSSEHPSAFQTPFSRLQSNFSLESGGRHGGAASGESQVPQMTSQQGASLGVTPVGNLSGVLNYASTTTSGKRTSDGTGVNSQPFSNPYSNSNGTNSMQSRPMNPPYFVWGGVSTGDSQLPDTQVVPSSSEGSGNQSSQSLPPSQPLAYYSQPSQGSQPFPLPPLPHTDRSYGPFFQLPPLNVPSKILDEELLGAMQHRLCEETSGYSVEQLEQVNSAMMARVWQMRSNWNRTEVAKSVMEVFEEVESEVREIQGVVDASGSFSN